MTKEEIRYMAEKTPGWEWTNLVRNNGGRIIKTPGGYHISTEYEDFEKVYLPLLIAQFLDVQEISIEYVISWGWTWDCFEREVAGDYADFYPTAQEARIAGTRYLMEVRK